MLTPDQIDDFVELTQPRFKRGSWVDLALPLTEYVSAKLIRKHKVMEQGGPYVSWKVKVRNTGLARNTGMFAQDVTGVEDLAAGARAPWTKQTTNFSYDIDEDIFQSDRETIVRELVMRDHGALSDMAELNEENLWTAPTSSSDTRPMGIPFWIQKDPSTTPGGAFSGGNPSGFSSGAGEISTTDYPRWDNWTFGYTNVTVEDLVAKCKKAMRNTLFHPPVPHPELGFGDDERIIYTTERVIDPLERLAESRNDNLGKDLAKYQNQVTIGGVQTQYVPYLEENDSDDPLYGINWRYFRPVCKTGATMRRHPPKQAPSQYSVRTVHIDNWMQYVCYNRRAQWVGSQA
jgi:hypothetical protein